MWGTTVLLTTQYLAKADRLARTSSPSRTAASRDGTAVVRRNLIQAVRTPEATNAAGLIWVLPLTLVERVQPAGLPAGMAADARGLDSDLRTGPGPSVRRCRRANAR